MPRIEVDARFRPLRARVTDPSNRARIFPTPSADDPPTEYWRGWLDGHTGAGHMTAALSAIAAITGFLLGAVLCLCWCK